MFIRADNWTRWVPILSLVILTTVAFARGLQGDFISDDRLMIAENHKLDSPQFIVDAFRKSVWENSSIKPERKSMYRPVYLLWYYAIHSLGGKTPVVFHAANLALHLINVLLVVLLIRLLVPQSSLLQQVIGATIFGLHPVNAGTVNWISGGTDLLMVLFLLIAFLSFHQHKNKANWRFSLLTLITYMIALFTKETAVMFLPIVIAFTWMNRTNREIRSMWIVLVLLVVVTLIYLLVRHTVLMQPGLESPLVLNAAGFDRLFEYMSLAARYLLIPWPLPFYFRHPPEGIAATWELVVGVSAMAGAFALFIKSRQARFPLLWSVLMLLPPMGLAFHPLGAFALRFLYSSTIGVAVLCVLALCSIAAHRHRSAHALGLATAALFFCLTFLAASDFRTEQSFYQKMITYDATYAGSYIRLAEAFLRSGDVSSAMDVYQTGISTAGGRFLPSLIEDLALLHAKLGDYERSVATYKMLLEDEKTETVALLGMANNYWMMRQHEEALQHYRQVLNLDDENFPALYNYARLNERLGNRSEALRAYQTLLKLPRTKDKEQAIQHAFRFVRDAARDRGSR